MTTADPGKIVRLLIPLARYCFRRSVDFNVLVRHLRDAYLQVAEEELRDAEVTVSRLHVATGIDRRVIKQFRTHGSKEARVPITQDMRGRVLAAWAHGKRFSDSRGNARPLTFQGGDSDFNKLCEGVSQSVNPASILFELERTGAVKREDNRLILVRSNPGPSAASEEGTDQIARDMELVLRAGTANLEREDTIGNLHIRTEFDNIYEHDIPKIRLWLLEQGKDLHKNLRAFLSECDKDMSPVPNPSAPAGAKVSLVTASLTDPGLPRVARKDQ
jgi:hypothetical protein